MRGSKVKLNEVLAQELHKPVIEKFKTIKVHGKFKDNIWAADVVKMSSLVSKNWGIKYLLCVIDVFTKYPWVKPLKDKKPKTVLNGLIQIAIESKCKPHMSLVDQAKQKNYNRIVIIVYKRKLLDGNWIFMHSTHNKGKSVVPERFTRISKAKICKKSYS